MTSKLCWQLDPLPHVLGSSRGENEAEIRLGDWQKFNSATLDTEGFHGPLNMIPSAELRPFEAIVPEATNHHGR
jgi:hypothetical protein